jgi:hypothetical protein
LSVDDNTTSFTWLLRGSGPLFPPLLLSSFSHYKHKLGEKKESFIKVVWEKYGKDDNASMAEAPRGYVISCSHSCSDIYLWTLLETYWSQKNMMFIMMDYLRSVMVTKAYISLHVWRPVNRVVLLGKRKGSIYYIRMPPVHS